MAEDLSSQPQRLSRYRSQRKAQQQAPDEVIPEVPDVPGDQPDPTDDSVTRRKSRYRRKNVASPAQADGRPATARAEDDRNGPAVAKTDHPMTTSPQPSIMPESQLNRASSTARREQEPRISPPAHHGNPRSGHPSVDADGYGTDGMEDHLPERQPRAGASHEGQAPMYDQKHLPNGELFPPPRPENVQSTVQSVQGQCPPSLDKVRVSKSQQPKLSDDHHEPRGCFGFFKRKRGEASPGADALVARPTATNEGLTDAPVSAVNAGDRSVLVECGKSKTVFPVTLTTTTSDIIKSAATCMSERINTRSAVLLEDFAKAGVQRPLRRYEHVRDVINSWDTDRQNSLLLVDPRTGSSEAELSLAGVPHDKPGDVSWLLSVSQRPGRWDKRMITLKLDGQLTMQRDPNKPLLQENICHLSDFDIYTPTQEKLRKQVRPPKKYCYAIKSQQKTGIFESTHDYVHFLCTNDKATADDFYAAVQGWRSWYLVNVLGEGRKLKSSEGHAVDNETRRMSKEHRRNESHDSHYQLGSFKPLMETQDTSARPSTARSANAPPPVFGVPARSAHQPDTVSGVERRPSTRHRQQHPPVSLGNKAQLADDEPLGNLARRTSLDQTRTSFDDGRLEEFAATGLLGRKYSQRQQHVEVREKQQLQQPFTSGPNLLNGGFDANHDDTLANRQSLDLVRRNPSVRTKHENRSLDDGGVKRNRSTRTHVSSDVTRSRSMRAANVPAKPLVDLTPEYRAPPQHANKGKGHSPDRNVPGALVESATTPEDPLGIPSSTDWRGANALNEVSQPLGRSLSQRGQQPKSTRSPDHHPFTGEGLLAGSRAQQGWGGGNRGRGVVDGSHADSPLMDVHEPSKFVQGSLLRKVEQERGRDGPVIDRAKRVEKEVKYGEGY
ncbi:hypothetical protein BAUCODRAFT_36508 [Baudoinia panamericana UAMH 10762]|uniref:PH domain-containing protein n=1 Tax=Baudoinia panamericana (strain UAMH 10762) TaxID=717646 RepID=M2MRF8_BAUPA|nr:uncharacterized protein BAUCODRAFT_36508 [Baudoinia panamericana UAMH 10762]EMC94038.1 hypothetical protein BAUCODRAFT_36508 [Baudoinia panamericana UAMH 10762]